MAAGKTVSRNRAAWFSKAAGRDETYDYLYSRAELEDIRSRALALATSYRTLTIIANNHFRGKEVASILELPAHPVLVLRGERERLVPLVPERLVQVDLESGRLTLDWHPDD